MSEQQPEPEVEDESPEAIRAMLQREWDANHADQYEHKDLSHPETPGTGTGPVLPPAFGGR